MYVHSMTICFVKYYFVRKTILSVSFGMKRIIAAFLFVSLFWNTASFIPVDAGYYDDSSISLLTQVRNQRGNGVSVSPFEVAQQENQAVAQAAFESAPAVVSIVGEFDDEVSVGSGFIVSEDGYIVTNKHVVPLTPTEYTVSFFDGSEADAEVVYRDPLYDIAVLHVDRTFNTILELGDISDIKAGEAIASIGNVMGMVENTVSPGYVSGFNKNIRAEDENEHIVTLIGLIQTSAFITPGFSGGPLIDNSGNAVGMNVATALSKNSSYAIPANVIKARIQQYL